MTSFRKLIARHCLQERARFEADALREQARLCPEHVPELYHFDAQLCLIVMQYLPPPARRGAPRADRREDLSQAGAASGHLHGQDPLWHLPFCARRQDVAVGCWTACYCSDTCFLPILTYLMPLLT